jgi:hypothetical protein
VIFCALAVLLLPSSAWSAATGSPASSAQSSRSAGSPTVYSATAAGPVSERLSARLAGLRLADPDPSSTPTASDPVGSDPSSTPSSSESASQPSSPDASPSSSSATSSTAAAPLDATGTEDPATVVQLADGDESILVGLLAAAGFLVALLAALLVVQIGHRG